jgi:hypothetical protein
MSYFKDGHFEPDGALINLPIGFIPDFMILCEVGATNPIFYYWWRRQEQDEASGSQEGVIDTAGTKTLAADSGGITAYDTSTQSPTLNEWTTARSTAATARTNTADGTYIRPSSSSTTDADAVFECTTAGTGSATEPTWNTGIGQTTLDGSTVWEAVNVARIRQGYKGVIIAAALMTNGQEMYYSAWKSDESVDEGDVDGWTDGIRPGTNLGN